MNWKTFCSKLSHTFRPYKRIRELSKEVNFLNDRIDRYCHELQTATEFTIIPIEKKVMVSAVDLYRRALDEGDYIDTLKLEFLQDLDPYVEVTKSYSPIHNSTVYNLRMFVGEKRK